MTTVSTQISKYIGAATQLANIWGTLVYNVKDTAYGAKGDGTTNDATAVQAAINAADDNGGTVIFPPGTYKLSANVTVPSNVTLWFINGAKLSIDSGVTVAINGPLLAEPVQVFSGSGAVTLSAYVPKVFPQWWGAKGDGTTDDTAAFRAALRSTVDYSDITAKRIIFVPAGTYIISGVLYLRKGDILVGMGGTSSVLFSSVNGSVILKMGKGLVDGVEVDDSGGLAPQVYGIYFQTSGSSTGIEVSVNGYRIDGCWFTCTIGISAGGTDGIITNCISDGGSHFMVISGDGSEYTASHSIVVSHCGIFAPSFAGIKLDGASDVIIGNCYFDYGKFFSIYSSGALASHRIQINNCSFLTSGDSSFYDATQKHISVGGGGIIDSIISCCIFARSRSKDIENSTSGTNGLKIDNCKFIDSNDVSLNLIAGDNIKISNCEWTDTGSYPIDVSTKIEVRDCKFLNPFTAGVPSNDYDKGCVRFQQTTSQYSKVVGCMTDSSGVAVLSSRSSSGFIWAESCRSEWTYDVYFFNGVEQTALNCRATQPSNEFRVVYGIQNGKRFFQGSAAPTDGTFVAGDIFWNTAPSAGGYVGWVCVSGGTPGTWKGFGTIET